MLGSATRQKNRRSGIGAHDAGRPAPTCLPAGIDGRDRHIASGLRRVSTYDLSGPGRAIPTKVSSGERWVRVLKWRR